MRAYKSLTIAFGHKHSSEKTMEQSEKYQYYTLVIF